MTSTPPALQSYGWPAKLFHWLTALSVITAAILGIVMLNIGNTPLASQLFDLHRSFGTLILALTAGRLVWRLRAPPPPMVASLPPWQEKVARLVHAALYVLLFVVPLVGWTGTSAYGAQISVFGLFTLPALTAKNKELSDVLLPLHEYLALTLCALFTLHIAAALYHHFIRKDDTLRRMLPQG